MQQPRKTPQGRHVIAQNETTPIVCVLLNSSLMGRGSVIQRLNDHSGGNRGHEFEVEEIEFVDTRNGLLDIDSRYAEFCTWTRAIDASIWDRL